MKIRIIYYSIIIIIIRIIY